MLSLGTRLGPYEVLAAIGEGGMGQVYRARDTKLDRDVAIKVLPESFALDPDRVARFTREAKTLAALNHPNIAAIYGLESNAPLDDARGAVSGSRTALVMELVEGQDLSELIGAARATPDVPGGIPVSDALPIARQIADALEAAHEQGIVHRDLKPANIKVRSDGTVKVLDFGLAKAVDPGTSGPLDPNNSPTLTARATQLGMILGTAAYMAPEQAKGKSVDKRADIWAFGVVLYEMLSGTRAFEGEDVSETMAAVLTREPDWSRLPASTPGPLIALMRRCLERDPKRRLRDIGEARLALDAPMVAMTTAASTAVAASSATGSKAVTLWRALAAILALLLAGVSVLWTQSAQPSSGTISRSAILLPENTAFDLGSFSVVAVSRDGSRIALIGNMNGVRRLFVRRLGDFEPKLLDNTEDASSPFFSPDGQWVGFFAGGRLKKVSSDGGPVIDLSEATDNRGGVWAEDDTIIFAPIAGGPVFRIPANGGTATAVSKIDDSKERTHRWPSMLPGGKSVLVTVGSIEHPDDYDDARIEAIRVDTGARTLVLEGGRMAKYAPTGHLLFAKGKVLFAVTFDPATGKAGPTRMPVIDGVSGDSTTGSANYALAESSGAVVFVPGDAGAGERRLAWVDLKGTVAPIDAPTALYADPGIQPGGKLLSVATGHSASTRDVDLIDPWRGTPSRLTEGGDNRTPLWLDDRRLVYVSQDRVRRVGTIMRRSADGTGEPEALMEIAGQVYLDDISSDGQAAIVTVHTSGAGSFAALFKVPLRKGAKPERIAWSAKGDVGAGSLSRDRRWLAFNTNESGRYEVFVQSFATGGNRVKVSTVGGYEPRWAPDGRTLYYAQANGMMAVPVEPGVAFSPGKAVRLFGGIAPTITDSGHTYALSPAGDRFLMLRFVREQVGPPEARMILNWFDELRARK